jgi:hypothetical protein
LSVSSGKSQSEPTIAHVAAATAVAATIQVLSAGRRSLDARDASAAVAVRSSTATGVDPSAVVVVSVSP